MKRQWKDLKEETEVAAATRKMMLQEADSVLVWERCEAEGFLFSIFPGDFLS